MDAIYAGDVIHTESEPGPNSMTYYHRAIGASFCMPDGREFRFLGGQFTTSDPAVKAQLDAVANNGTSMIYTRKEGVAKQMQIENALAADAVTIGVGDGPNSKEAVTQSLIAQALAGARAK